MKEHAMKIYRRLIKHCAMGTCDMRLNIWPCRESNPGQPAHNIVSIPSEVSQLCFNFNKCIFCYIFNYSFGHNFVRYQKTAPIHI